MTSFAQALATSCWLAEKVASAPCADLRERQAMADFLTFGLFKHAHLDPQALSTLQRGLGWGVGLGLPALGVGHLRGKLGKIASLLGLELKVVGDRPSGPL